MNLQGRMVQKTSKKGATYEALIITFPSGYEKLVFLDNAEKFLINAINEKK